MKNYLDKIFKISESDSTLRNEFIGGITTFMTIAYILVLNPSILSTTGMDRDALFTATALSAAFASIMMGLLANLPIALAPGVGINIFFAYTIVLQMGYSWEMALAAVFIEGIIFILLSIFKIRELIINAIPPILKQGISIGIGLFIAIIGLVNSDLIVQGGSLSQQGNMQDPAIFLTLIAIVIVAILLTKKVTGSLLLGMIITTIIAIPLGVVTIPDNFTLWSMPHSIEPIFMKMDFSNIFTIDMLVVIFTLIFSDIFDTAGTLIAICSKSNMVDKDGNIKNIKKAFLADAVATTVGATIGTSTVTSYIESSTGVAAGGRTGLTAIITGLMFIVALFISPLFALIPTAATSAILVTIGVFMIANISSIDFEDYKDSIPLFITMLFIPLSYNIANGIVYGFLSYVVIRILLGQYRDLNLIMYILSILFVLKIVMIN